MGNLYVATGSSRSDIAGPGSMSQGIEAMVLRIPIDLGISSNAWVAIGGRRCIRVVPKSARRLLVVYDLYGAEYDERMNYQAVVPGDVSPNYHHKNKKSATTLSIKSSISPPLKSVFQTAFQLSLLQCFRKSTRLLVLPRWR